MVGIVANIGPNIGHNSGRVGEPGKSWRTHVWAKARSDLMPKLPIEVIRRRVARAKELGLPYKTYAGFRAASGDDLVGFMFSSNALDLLRATDRVPTAKVAKLDALNDVRTVGLAHVPIALEHLTPPLQLAYAAPKSLAPWVQTRDVMRALFAQTGGPASRFVLVCNTDLEREWAQAGRMAGTLSAPDYFEAIT
ncbi:hypothetical protein OAN307_c14890 [Octadecabacter antarcticus 307]|uniref:Uncharacterized protein n=1 Tax=Octadecabacter antarcticus 307 TaxID=391626 RepID=M9R3F4_9RHOB|nr:hypothetical protein [Octadecabacter antarcticus]AGI67164.1 hypothetical protein OAN307_c14890 [Octadecabacter antarcticus 307]